MIVRAVDYMCTCERKLDSLWKFILVLVSLYINFTLVIFFLLGIRDDLTVCLVLSFFHGFRLPMAVKGRCTTDMDTTPYKEKKVHLG